MPIIDAGESSWWQCSTRKASCRWQTRATLAKSLHGLRKSSGVVSCVARLSIVSVPMVSYYVLYSNRVCKMRRFGDTRLLNPPSFGTFLWGDPLRIFRWIIPRQKLESWGYRTVYISRSCFRSARHNTDVSQTDGRTDGQTYTSLSQRPALA